MELNRAVCIDLPQAQVPWFHEKFCENVRAGAGEKSDLYNRSDSFHI